MLKTVKVSDLRVDHSYQRPLDEPRVKRYAANWKPECLGIPPVSQRDDGSMYLIDAQQRCASLRLRNPQATLSVEVFLGLSVQDEAALFLDRNRTTLVNAFYKFRARLTAGDPVALDIQRLVEAEGLRISKGGDGRSVGAVDALEYAYNKTTLKQALQVLASWGSLKDRNVLDGRFIKHISAFFYSNRAVPVGSMSAALFPFTAGALENRFKIDKAARPELNAERSAVVTLVNILETHKRKTAPRKRRVNRAQPHRNPPAP